MPVSDPVVVVAAARTPTGAFQGALKDVPAPQLGGTAIACALERAGMAGHSVDEILMGCVLAAGQGQAPARQAALAAGLPVSACCTTVNKMCGSGMKAVMLGHDMILAGSAGVVVAGGMESMSRAPYLLDRARSGYRMGHGAILDHMLLDGLEDAYEPGRHVGTYAEDCAAAYGFTREAQDAYALESLARARRAQAEGWFSAEIAPVDTGCETSMRDDEPPARARPEKISRLRPAFREGGTVTAANASSISDGAAAVVLMRRSDADRRHLEPLAVIAGHASVAGPPPEFPTAPVGAVRRLLERTGWPLASVDLVEINEAFAAVAMAALRDLELPPDRLNVHGGACALGHPIGASGARILVTLIHALQTHGLRRGMAAICIGGGEATAVAVERL